MRRLVAVAVLVLAGVLAPGAVAAPPDDECPTAMPLQDVKADSSVDGGFAAKGWTVSRGVAPEEFDVRVLGVLDDGVAPGVDMIIVEVSGTPAIDHAQGIWAGMSGSPVYADGQLVGAVAYGLSFGPSKIGGLAAAEDMQRVLAYSTEPALRKSVQLPAALARRVAGSDTARMNRLRLPFAVSGLSAGRAKTLVDRLGGLDGAIPYAAGAASAAPGDPAAIVPGGNFAAALSHGFLTAAGVGTTTFVCGERAVAFGHPMLFEGATSLSAHTADAIAIQDDPTFVPFKIANVGGVVGTLDQDRLSGIGALLDGHGPAGTAKVTSTVNGSPVAETIVNRTGDVPGIAPSHLLAHIDGEADRIGGGTAALSWSAVLTAGTKQYSISRNNRFADQADVSFSSIFEMAEHLFTITENPFTEVKIKSVDVEATVGSAFREYRITGLQRRAGTAWVPVAESSPIPAAAGTTLQIRVLLSSYRSAGPVAPVVFSFPIPDGAEGSSGSLEVTGGSGGGGGEEGELAVADEEGSAEPASVGELIDALEATPRNDEIQAALSLFSEGSEGPDGPPSPSPAPILRTADVAEVVSGGLGVPVRVPGPPEEPQPSPGPALDLLGRSSLKLSNALSRGIPVTVRAGARGRLVLRASVDKRTARRLGLKRRTVGSLTRTVRAGRTVVRLKLTAKARRRMRRMRNVKLTLTAVLTDLEGGRRTDRRVVRLKRRT